MNIDIRAAQADVLPNPTRLPRVDMKSDPLSERSCDYVSAKPLKIQPVQIHTHGQSFLGSLKMTPNHLIFQSTARDLWYPYPIVNTVERRIPSADGSQSALRFRNRDFSSITLFFSSRSDCDYVFEHIMGHTCITSVLCLYAFSYKPGLLESSLNSWSLYDPRKEFIRLGVNTRTKEWRFTNVNMNFERCPTYPELLVVPSKISDNTLNYGYKYRSKGRIPALTYIHTLNNCTITRSSQPLVGIKQNRSIQDEKLLEAIFATTHPDGVYGSQANNLIIDARPTKNAFANVAIGAGTEDMNNYKNAHKAYLGIDNIHVMRDSLAKVVEAIKDSDLVPLPPNRELLAKSGWLKHISAIIDGSLLITRTIHIQHSSVLVHCSDGWDRTSQLSAISQLCLDPYYRTVEGFMILVEKDWMSFGHRFADRCDHLTSEKAFYTTDGGNSTLASMIIKPFFGTKESSPVFHQFLDCTEQIRQQFPNRFEFNGRFLKRILYHFEKQRCEHRVRENTRSLWDYFLTRRSDFVNECYNPALDLPGDTVLLPDPKHVQWWSDVFGRTDEEMNSGLSKGEILGVGVDFIK
ncbi:Phosphoinositide 3-phosphatase [Neolecta irregularis DAH-3]|uniref:Phosphoinositide 3-phosphatase n=1 Tax=Neolecta irregularis (strain DAH-3) TaxID=1198029 RepID=A0A1U7LQV7_NEOID|nr:Phosphoinositide 3-phosphatase [Neolecta irregularis DAH-3]|eukprot:OLL25056.1 Phosphoinositide 3-phosphatase [Neolecta irregularis DAH-3]